MENAKPWPAGFAVRSLVSGSSGNAYLFSCDGEALLLDAGLSLKALKQALADVLDGGLRLLAILITHEHSDHMKGCEAIAAHYQIPVYSGAGTCKALIRKMRKPGRIEFRSLEAETRFALGPFTIQSFRLFHDAVDPLAYMVDVGESRVAVLTDTGIFPDFMEEELAKSKLLFLEANYDDRMLQHGPYPYLLRQRISGNLGHLSNEEASRWLLRLARQGLSHFVLAHLSEVNNHPNVAMEEVRKALLAESMEGIEVEIAPRYVPSKWYCLS